MAYSSSSTSTGTSSMGSSVGTTSSTSTGTSGASVGTTSSTSTGTSGASVGTSASTGMNSSGSNSTNGSTGTSNNTGFTGLSYSNGTWSLNGNSLGTLSLGAPGLSGFTSNSFDTGWSDNGSSSEPAMTVDEVYGKGNPSSSNQSMVENQGDYEASSNEKSNVETSTFGKQDDITVTPESVTENKGEFENDDIQSIEGLNFQQKDKESQDVLEARKSRDDVEAEDKSNQMRDSLKAKTEQTTEEDNNAFQVGEENTFEEENNAKLAELNQKNQELENAKNEEEDAIVAAEKAEAEAKEADKAVEEALNLENRAKQLAVRIAEKKKGDRLAKDDSFLKGLGKIGKAAISPFINDPELQGLEEEAISLAKALGTDAADILEADTFGDILPGGKEIQLGKVQENLANIAADRVAVAKDNQQKAQETAKSARAHATELTAKVQEAQVNYDKANQDYNTWKTEYWAGAEKTKAEEESKAKAEEVANTQSNVEIAFQAAKDKISKSNLSEETKSQALETINNVEASTKDLNEAADALAANPEDPSIITTYVKAIETYNKSLKNAIKDNSLKNTDYNKTFTELAAKANDFDVTMPDGTKVSFAEFATEMATKSPALAKGLYEAKANAYEEAGHTILAQIERAKAKMVTTWLGSKFTFADNQVRSQFNQMAKTDMRATYATYNNVLNDPNATPEAKADAQAQIAQANSLMTASATLQASTGFLSGFGDSMEDGIYGVTNPNALNVGQKVLNAANNFIQITLGLGVTPGANKAYQNMYYLAGAKANNSALFTTDFDSDGFALCQEYGNNAAVGMIVGAGELATAVALMFNPATSKMGINLAIDAVQTFFDGLYGVQNEVNKSIKYSNKVLSYFNEAKSIAAETGNKEATGTIDSAIKQIEDFQLKSDEVGNLDNWLEGSGSNTATNEKFNQSLTYDEWLKLIEADPTMRDYAKKLIAEKKEK